MKDIIKLRYDRIALKLTNDTYFVYKETPRGYQQVRTYSKKEVDEMRLPGNGSISSVSPYLDNPKDNKTDSDKLMHRRIEGNHKARVQLQEGQVMKHHLRTGVIDESKLAWGLRNRIHEMELKLKKLCAHRYGTESPRFSNG